MYIYDMNQTRQARIIDILKVFNPIHIDLKDDSAKHAHHIQHLGKAEIEGGETHYKLVMVSEKFKGVPRIDRQRMVNDLLAEEFKKGLHAFQMKLMSPEEFKN